MHIPKNCSRQRQKYSVQQKLHQIRLETLDFSLKSTWNYLKHSLVFREEETKKANGRKDFVNFLSNPRKKT